MEREQSLTDPGLNYITAQSFASPHPTAEGGPVMLLQEMHPPNKRR